MHEELTNGESLADLPIDVDPPSFAVVAGDEADAIGAIPGDRLTRIGSQAVRGTDDLYRPILRAHPGQRVIFEFEPPPASGRGPYTKSVVLQPMRSAPATFGDWLVFAIGGAGLPFLCLTLGYWVAAIRIRDPLAWLLLLLLLSMSQFGGSSWRDVIGDFGFWHPVAALYQGVFANLWPLSMMLFGIYFPDRVSLDRRYPGLKWIVIAPLLFQGLGTNVAIDLSMLTDRPGLHALKASSAGSGHSSSRCMRWRLPSSSSPSVTRRSPNGSPMHGVGSGCSTPVPSWRSRLSSSPSS